MKKVLFFFILISSYSFANKTLFYTNFIETEYLIVVEENVCEIQETQAISEPSVTQENYYAPIEQTNLENTCAIDSTQEYFKGKSLSLNSESPCSAGSKDAELYHDQNLLFGIGGFFLSWPAIVIAAVYEPEPNIKAPALSGKEITNSFEYRQCYASKAKNKNIKSAVIGAVSQVVVFVLSYAAFIIYITSVI
jgi:hypothetical protein